MDSLKLMHALDANIKPHESLTTKSSQFIKISISFANFFQFKSYFVTNIFIRKNLALPSGVLKLL